MASSAAAGFLGRSSSSNANMRGLVQFIADLRNARARELEEKILIGAIRATDKSSKVWRLPRCWEARESNYDPRLTVIHCRWQPERLP
jgi:hypothetical protein